MHVLIAWPNVPPDKFLVFDCKLSNLPWPIVSEVLHGLPHFSTHSNYMLLRVTRDQDSHVRTDRRILGSMSDSRTFPADSRTWIYDSRTFPAIAIM